jgi:hypothetical protein
MRNSALRRNLLAAVVIPVCLLLCVPAIEVYLLHERPKWHFACLLALGYAIGALLATTAMWLVQRSKGKH